MFAGLETVVEEIKDREAFDEAVEALRDAMNVTWLPIFKALHPTFGDTEQEKRESIQRDKDRRWAEHKSHPESSHWLCARDVRNQKIVGCIRWKIFQTNPFSNGPQRLECTWWPEGEGRDWVTEMINDCFVVRQNWLRRPHVVMGDLGVLPSYQGQGLAKLRTASGLERTDALGLESITEASEAGRWLYEQFDYRALVAQHIGPRKKHPGPVWTEMSAELDGQVRYPMWRPPMGKWQEGEREHPWLGIQRVKEEYRLSSSR